MARCLGTAPGVAFLPALPGLTVTRRNDDLRCCHAGDATTVGGDVDPDTQEMSENCRPAIDAYRPKGGK